MKVLHVVGARPNFMKAAPVIRALRRFSPEQLLVHTGQHYDRTMSEIFFRQLDLPEPDLNLGVGSGTHSYQTAQVMLRFDTVVKDTRPDLVLVYGDVNSTLAAALVSAQRGVAVGHVEAGLRSFDPTMPEELNRVLTDRISNLLFTPSADGDENLLREGVPPERIVRAGNVMIDTLVRLLPRTRPEEVLRSHGLERRTLVLVTLHRPSNVDSPEALGRILEALERIATDTPVVFPVHPRTRRKIESSGFAPRAIRLIEPLGYLEFLALQREALAVITDSGGVQEETTFLNVPCLTVRENTERPLTVRMGTNELVGSDMGLLEARIAEVRSGRWKQGTVPPLWDGKAAERIAEHLIGVQLASPGPERS